MSSKQGGKAKSSKQPKSEKEYDEVSSAARLKNSNGTVLMSRMFCANASVLLGANGSPAISMAPFLPPQHCMSKLVTRADDTEEVIKHRIDIYNEKSRPVEEFYRSSGTLLEFDLPGGIPQSWPKLLEVLDLDDYKEQQSAAA